MYPMASCIRLRFTVSTGEPVFTNESAWVARWPKRVSLPLNVEGTERDRVQIGPMCFGPIGCCGFPFSAQHATMFGELQHGRVCHVIVCATSLAPDPVFHSSAQTFHHRDHCNRAAPWSPCPATLLHIFQMTLNPGEIGRRLASID